MSNGFSSVASEMIEHAQPAVLRVEVGSHSIKCWCCVNRQAA
jgi:hypothetical protein